MEENILISWLNDFIFCPVSIYFHNLYGNLDKNLYTGEKQTLGINSHKTIDEKKYSSRKDILQSIDIYSEKYGLQGKIDIFDKKNGVLTERKNYISKVYDGYVFQLYAQYYCLCEMGYQVKRLRFHSMKDNKNYEISLPDENTEMKQKFENLIQEMRNFKIDNYKQPNQEKCNNCVYENACDRRDNA